MTPGGSAGASAGSATTPPPPDPDRTQPISPQPISPPGAGTPPSPRPDGEPPAAAPRRRRTGLIVAGLTVVVLVLVAGALVVVRPGPVRQVFEAAVPSATRPAGLPADPAPREVLAAAGTDAPIPTAAGVARLVNPQIKALGNHFGISVVDVATGQSLYERGGATPITPASTTKIVTAAAVLTAMDPAKRLATRAVAGARSGEVVLIGGGDPTLSIGRTQAYPGAARLDQLAAQVKRALGGTVPTSVTVDSTLFTGPVFEPGWDPDTPGGGYASATVAIATDGARKNPRSGSGGPRFPQPDLAAGQAFARLLGVPPAAVRLGKAPPEPAGAGPTEGPTPPPSATPESGTAPSETGAPKAPGAELGRIESPPVLRLLDWMMSLSDNIIAEALARQVAIAAGEPATYRGATAATQATLAGLGLPAAQLSAADGSGLSRTNKFTSDALVKLLTVAANGTQPRLQPLFSGLPVAGWSGTLKKRYQAANAGRAGAGVVRAKTGSLTKVNAIAGVVVNADGRLLAFSILADKVPNGWLAVVAMDRIAAGLARCGCR